MYLTDKGDYYSLATSGRREGTFSWITDLLLIYKWNNNTYQMCHSILLQATTPQKIWGFLVLRGLFWNVPDWNIPFVVSKFKVPNMISHLKMRGWARKQGNTKPHIVTTIYFLGFVVNTVFKNQLQGLSHWRASFGKRAWLNFMIAYICKWN